MLENAFQKQLIQKIKKRWKDAVVLKNDSGYIQGIPDIIILIGDKWFALEAKRSKSAHHQPNQDYYVDKLNSMSYARFVYPENERDVLHEIDNIIRGE